jgi:hypothetical protein
MAATVASGQQNQYSTAVSGGTVPSDLHIRDVPDWIDKLQRTDVPLQKMFGTAPAPSTPIHKAEWGWGSPDPYATTITEAISGTGDLSITVADGLYFQVGDRFLIDDEELRCTGISGNVLTVTRGFAGTTAATHLDNADVYIMGPAVVEGADDADSPFTQGEVDFNYPQIMSFTWALSKRADVTPTYEHRNGARASAELRKKMENTAPVRMELTYLLGQRALGTGSAPSALGGLRQDSFITTRNDLSSAIFTETDLMSAMQTVNNLVGGTLMPDTLVLSPFAKRVVNSWYNETRRSSPSDNKMDVRWNEIETDFGPVKLVSHYLLSTIANDKAYLMNPEDFKRRPYASSTGWNTGTYETQGWHTRGFLRQDSTLIAQRADSRAEIYGFSTTAGDYSGLA